MNHTLIIIKNGQPQRFSSVINLAAQIPGAIIHGFSQFSVGALSFKIIPADSIHEQIAGLLLNKRVVIHQTAIKQNDAARIVNRIRAAGQVEFLFTETMEDLAKVLKEEIAGPLVSV